MKVKGRGPGGLMAPHKTALEALRDGMTKLFPDRSFEDGFDIEELLRLIYFGDLKDHERVQALLQVLKYTRPQLKQVDHTGTVARINADLSPKEIEDILAADPFRRAIEVKHDGS